MYELINYFRGYVRLRITGAAPEKCLNALSQEGIAFWGIIKEDDLHYSLFSYTADAAMVNRLAMKEFCSCELLAHFGFRAAFRGLRKRPVLLLGLLLALTATFVLQGFVWTIQVEGNTTLHEQEILRALKTLDIAVGTWGANINSERTKNQMLNLVPELQWIAVNRTGGYLQVLLHERAMPDKDEDPYQFANVIAARDGVLTEVSVLEGMKLCAAGQTVRKGQLLVSGYEDYGQMTRVVRASAEIYATTWHTGTLVMPSQAMEKVYTGEQWTQKTLLIGEKRINLYGNSGIYTDNCDKIISTRVLSLPGGYDFPIVLETAVYRQYRLVPRELSPLIAQEQLETAWERLTVSAMIAGEIQSTEASVIRSGELYVLNANSTCKEMIARAMPITIADDGAVAKENTNDGTDYQRREN
ncbi:MAG: sporulation protein YqfD [Oscillospiraceae bacterium]|jgi:similar to stage IV sporulation protein|nr:sporulation protein YqfD [Oscillospiraceae bacterium]